MNHGDVQSILIDTFHDARRRRALLTLRGVGRRKGVPIGGVVQRQVYGWVGTYVGGEVQR